MTWWIAFSPPRAVLSWLCSQQHVQDGEEVHARGRIQVPLSGYAVLLPLIVSQVTFPFGQQVGRGWNSAAGT